jgi:flagellar hook protein FlgE
MSNFVRTIISDGVQEQTNRPLDFVIQGKGFFVVSDGATNYLTRAGNFAVDKEGFIVTLDGKRLLGFNAAGELTPVNIRQATLNPRATGNLTLAMNLDATSPVTAFPANPATFNEIAASSSFSFTMEVVDSLGQPRSISVFLAKTAPNTWEARFYADPLSVGQTGAPVLLGNSVLQFSNFGQLISNPQIVLNNIQWQGAAPMNLTINLQGVTQYASGSVVYSQVSDGQTVAEPVQISLDSQGQLNILMSNGSSINLATLAVGIVPSEELLKRVSNNLFLATDGLEIRNPGLDRLGVSFSNGALERSTVDLAEEFVNMITLQRGFEANSKVITTNQNLVQVALNMVK